MRAKGPPAVPTANMPRLQASRDGRETYIGQRPCRRGHNSLRYVADGECVECTRLLVEANVRARQYMLAHPGASRPPAARYDVGVPCPLGHTEGRWLKTGRCIACRRERARQVREKRNTPMCLPIAKTPNRSWHILEGELTPGERIEFPALWTDGMWKAQKNPHRTPNQAAFMGWTYIRPA